MTTQPEALRLVNNRHNAHMLTWQANACAELRRLHALNAELLEALEIAMPFLEDAETDFTYNRDKVKAKLAKVRAAIAKATGATA